MICQMHPKIKCFGSRRVSAQDPNPPRALESRTRVGFSVFLERTWLNIRFAPLVAPFQEQRRLMFSSSRSKALKQAHRSPNLNLCLCVLPSACCAVVFSPYEPLKSIGLRSSFLTSFECRRDRSRASARRRSRKLASFSRRERCKYWYVLSVPAVIGF